MEQFTYRTNLRQNDKLWAVQETPENHTYVVFLKITAHCDYDMKVHLFTYLLTYLLTIKTRKALT